MPPQTRKRTRQQHTRTDADTTAARTERPLDTQPECTNGAGGQEAEEAESDDDAQDEDEQEVVLSEQFDGPTDAAGKPHGRGCLTVHFQRGAWQGRNVFAGLFSHGLKSGSGCWQFDVGGPHESSLEGSFVNDALEGEGRYTDSDGSHTVGQYTAGSLNGRVSEYAADGQLLYCGDYGDNQRHGQGTLQHSDGGTFHGEWQHGLFHGIANTYTYPVVANRTIQFRGEWREGSMQATRLYIDGQQASDTVYADDESTLGSPIAEHPLLPDPYEQHTVYVAPSSLGPQAGEGLFARVDLPPGVCASFYNGVKQSEQETERRHWRHNGNCIALDEAAGVDIDVPQHLAATDRYCASLGHKANHAFDARLQNCIYSHYYHPRHGHVKCVRVRADRPGGVKAGEELLVEYGYAVRGGPQWWKAGRREWKAQQAAREKEAIMNGGAKVGQRVMRGHKKRRK